MGVLANFKVCGLLVAVLGVYQVTAFTCYKCTTNENDLCADKPQELPANTAIVNCDGYCTLVRTEFTDIPGEVVTLVRDCSKEAPLIMNDVRTDKHYTKMYTTCNTDKCNSGDGYRDPGSGSGGYFGPKDRIIVPESSGSGVITSVFSHLIGGLLLCYVVGIRPW